jgi:hypothetical protein
LNVRRALHKRKGVYDEEEDDEEEPERRDEKRAQRLERNGRIVEVLREVEGMDVDEVKTIVAASVSVKKGKAKAPKKVRHPKRCRFGYPAD